MLVSLYFTYRHLGFTHQLQDLRLVPVGPIIQLNSELCKLVHSISMRTQASYKYELAGSPLITQVALLVFLPSNFR